LIGLVSLAMATEYSFSARVASVPFSSKVTSQYETTTYRPSSTSSGYVQYKLSPGEYNFYLYANDANGLKVDYFTGNGYTYSNPENVQSYGHKWTISINSYGDFVFKGVGEVTTGNDCKYSVKIDVTADDALVDWPKLKGKSYASQLQLTFTSGSLFSSSEHAYVDNLCPGEYTLNTGTLLSRSDHVTRKVTVDSAIAIEMTDYGTSFTDTFWIPIREKQTGTGSWLVGMIISIIIFVIVVVILVVLWRKFCRRQPSYTTAVVVNPAPYSAIPAGPAPVNGPYGGGHATGFSGQPYGGPPPHHDRSFAPSNYPARAPPGPSPVHHTAAPYDDGRH